METISGGPSDETRDFRPNQILEAAKLNKALENWVVSEVPGADEGEIGDVVFVTGPGDGSPGGAPGLVHIETRKFNNEVTAEFDDVFSSKYEFYKINLSFITTTNEDLRYQWRDGSVNLSESHYDSSIAILGASYESDRLVDGYYGRLVKNTGVYTHTMTMELSGLTENGQGNQSPTLVGNSYRTNAMFSFGSTYKKRGSVTGMRIWPNSGTWSGTISIYGYSGVRNG